MKKLKLLLLCLPFSLLANSQAGQINQINIVSFTVKNILPGTIDNWISTPGALLMVAQKVPGPVPMREPRLVVQIRSNGAVICGNNAATGKQVDPFDVRTFNTADLTGILTNCHELKEGTYTICAQFFNIDKIAISKEVCKDFRVEATSIEYAPPTLITPDNGKKFNAQELQSPVMFRWSSLVPKPKEPVTYRMKVWQLMQGQNGTTAMRSNQPIVTKDVDNITQATVSGIYTGPCRPPYLCDYIWNVQAIDRNGKPMGNNNGMSEPYTFGVAEDAAKCTENIFPEDKKQISSKDAMGSITFTWKPKVRESPTEPKRSYRMKVWQLMQGQNGSTAMRSNQPIVTKDVMDITQATVTGLWTGPCKPPYLCDFIWTVEVLGAAGQTGCTSEPTTFSVTEGTTTCTENIFPEDKKQMSSKDAMNGITFKWKPVGPRESPSHASYRMKVWQLMQGQNGSTAMKTNQPIVTKDIIDIPTEITVSGIWTGPCKPPYLCDYVWAVEMRNAAGQTVCTSEPTTFSVTEETTKCTENLFPEDKKKLNSKDAKTGITFKWKPIGPRESPSHPSYRMKVWQLMQGQNGSTAMRSNKPIVTKDVADITETTVNGIWTGPCKPPYLCNYVWTVEARNAAGQTVCTSEPTAFSVANNDIDIQIDSVHVSCCGTNGLQNIYIKIKNNLSNTVKITNLNIDKVNGVTNVISITGLSPTLPVNITGLGSQAFTGTIKCIDTAKTIRFFVRAEDATDNAITETEVETDTLNCPCNPCMWMTAAVDKDSLSLPKNGNPTQVNLVGTFTGLNNNLIKKVTAEIIYFNIQQTKDTSCAKCVFDSKNYGNFYPPGSALPGYTGPVFNKPDYSRLVTWNSTIIKDCGGQPHDGGGVDNGDPTIKGSLFNVIKDTVATGRQTPRRDFGDKSIAPGNGIPPPPPLPNFNLPIAVPEMNSLGCCGDVIKICIRYTFYDFCCHACEVIRCYTIKREK